MTADIPAQASAASLEDRAYRATDRTRVSYDAVARDYAAQFGDELSAKPLDRALLLALTELAPAGVIADVGCGPGHVTSFLAAHRPTVVGFDLSAAMITVARGIRSDLPFAVADLRDLPLADQSCAGLVSLYSIIHLPSAELSATFVEFRRVLCQGGWLLVSVHISDAHHQPGGVNHLTNWFDRSVDLDGYFFHPDQLTHLLADAGLQATARLDRDPAAGEYPSRRGYLFAQAGHQQ